MLHYCNDHLDAEKENDTFQAFAVLGIAMIAMGEEVGIEMAIRSFNHLVSNDRPPPLPLPFFFLFAYDFLDALRRTRH